MLKKFDKIFLGLVLALFLLSVFQIGFSSAQLTHFGSDMLKRSVFPILYSVVLIVLICVSMAGVMVKSEKVMNSFMLAVNILAFISLFHFTVLVVSVDIEDVDYHKTLTRNFFSEPDKAFVDYTQQNYQCCGLSGPKDYPADLPASCCASNDQATCNYKAVDFFQQSCFPVLFHETRKFFGFTVGIVMAQILISLAAGYFANLLFKDYIRQRLDKAEARLKANMANI